ncbi:MAG: hypothetical protein WC759_03565 [Candidatus Micrarchaeia archaeon]|jgi:hypothetical protein
MTSGKGQAAMEYLTTYGWAVLVIAIVLVALAWLGIFNVQQQVPDRCVFQQGVECMAARMGTRISSGATVNYISAITIRNDLGKMMYACTVFCATDMKPPEGSAYNTGINVNLCRGVPPGGQVTLSKVGTEVAGTCNTYDFKSANVPVGSKATYKLALVYWLEGDDFSATTKGPRVMFGDFVGTVQSG